MVLREDGYLEHAKHGLMETGHIENQYSILRLLLIETNTLNRSNYRLYFIPALQIWVDMRCPQRPYDGPWVFFWASSQKLLLR